MAYHKDGYYYDQQIRTYILQFMAIFTDIQVEIGKHGDQEKTLISVPIHYGAADRVAASIVAGNTQNRPVRVPVISAYMMAIEFDPGRTAGHGQTIRNVYTPTGGLVPEDMRTVYTRKALPVRITMDLSLYASNHNQHFQLIEQILPVFDPDLMIQTSDGVFDPARMSTVKLVRSQMDSNYPIGTDRRVIQSTYTFELLGWLSLPSEVRDDVVRRIYLRIGAVSTDDASNEELISELDAGGFQYNLIKDTDTLDIGDHPTNLS